MFPRTLQFACPAEFLFFSQHASSSTKLSTCTTHHHPLFAMNTATAQRKVSSHEDPNSPSDELRVPALKPLRSNSPRTQYLILYNFVSAILWLVVLGRVVLLVPLVGFERTYAGVGIFAKWTQTLALLEVVHAATGKCNAVFRGEPWGLFQQASNSVIKQASSARRSQQRVCKLRAGSYWFGPLSTIFPGLLRVPAILAC